MIVDIDVLNQVFVPILDATLANTIDMRYSTDILDIFKGATTSSQDSEIRSLALSEDTSSETKIFHYSFLCDLSSVTSAAGIVFKNIALKFYSEDEIIKGIRTNEY